MRSSSAIPAGSRAREPTGPPSEYPPLSLRPRLSWRQCPLTSRQPSSSRVRCRFGATRSSDSSVVTSTSSRAHCRVERQLEECPGRYWADDDPYRDTKTGESNTVYVSPEVMQVLSRHLESYVAPAPTAPIFPATNGQPLRPGSFFRQWDLARKRVGLTHVRFHDLRHYAATMLGRAAPVWLN